MQHLLWLIHKVHKAHAGQQESPATDKNINKSTKTILVYSLVQSENKD